MVDNLLWEWMGGKEGGGCHAPENVLTVLKDVNQKLSPESRNQEEG